MLMRLAVARETARGLERGGIKKKHRSGLLVHTFAFYKDINTTGAQRWKRSKITLASEKRKFVLVMVMDPPAPPSVGRG